MLTNTRILFFIVCVSYQMDSIHVLYGQSNPLVLSCGSETGGVDIDEREWSSDSKYLISNDSVRMSANFQDPSLESEVPYMSARLFTSEATYRFSIKPNKRICLRLHFYPADYGNFSSKSSFFTVIANGLTLLKNFSASITCEALSQSFIVKEYYLASMKLETFIVVFKPNNNTFAFINGIEVFPIPEIFDSAKVVESFKEIDIESLNSQTMYRLNVGGHFVPPTRDSLLRTWTEDTSFITGSAFGRTNIASPDIKIQYQGVPEYIAPREIYSSSRSMAVNENISLSFNLSWSLQVDSKCTYLLRFHFCDFYYSRPNELVFSIFVDNKTAEPTADVIGWSGGRGITTYQDYLIYAGDQKLWVALHPAIQTQPEVVDAFLNGLEVFKLTDATGTFASNNPELKDTVFKNDHPADNYLKMIFGATILSITFGIMATLFLLLHGRKKGSISTISTLPHGLHRHFSLSEIKKATNHFDESYIIGVGGFGKVYRGVIDGRTVAIKRSNPCSEQGVNEFKTEVEILSKVRHRNLVSLIGFCENNGEMCLVYDYMARGTLKEHIHEGHLAWKDRLQISLGAAKGIDHLHSGTSSTIVHRDIKSTNILLDENWVAKVSDFGLSKEYPNVDVDHITTMVKGSFGYLDPEYNRSQRLTEKSDIYSFGVVLLEMLSARPALIKTASGNQIRLVDWALKHIRDETFNDIIDSNLKEVHPDCLKKFLETAKICLAEVGQERPSMAEVITTLEEILNSNDNQGNGEYTDNKAIFSLIVNPEGR